MCIQGYVTTLFSPFLILIFCFHLLCILNYVLSLFRLITSFSKFFQLVYVIAFLFSTITICGTMLMAQMTIVSYFWNLPSKKGLFLFDNFILFQTHHESDPTVFVMLIDEAVYAFGVVFIICELFQLVSD